MVDHYPLFEFACSKYKNVHHVCIKEAISSFMLCIYGIDLHRGISTYGAFIINI